MNEVTQLGTIGEVHRAPDYLTLNTGSGAILVLLANTTRVVVYDGAGDHASGPDALVPGVQAQAQGTMLSDTQMQAIFVRMIQPAPPPPPPVTPPPPPPGTGGPQIQPPIAPPPQPGAALHQGPVIAHDAGVGNIALLATLLGQLVAVNYSAAQIVWDNGAPASAANLQPGAWVAAEGNIDASGALHGTKIYVRPATPTLPKQENLITVDGSVLESYPQYGACAVQGNDGRRWVVAFGGYTNIVINEGGKAGADAVAPGRVVQLRGTHMPDTGALVVRSLKIMG
jgi:hypothetical protein